MNGLGDCPEEANIVFYDSFAETYQGHGTDKALIGGLLGMDTADTRIRQSLEVAKEVGMQYHFEFEDQCDDLSASKYDGRNSQKR